MAQKTAPLLPATTELLSRFGERLRLARLRRRLTARQVAERSGMSPMTLRSLERGGSGVTMGAYLAVMQVLGIENDLKLLGQADPVGRDLQDAQLPAPTRQAPPKPSSAARSPHARKPALQPASPASKPMKPSGDGRAWIARGGFANPEALAGLLTPVKPSKKKGA
jgi:transcriptional regulator with XRE-family HTH domain